GVLVIGRAPEADIRIDAVSISRRHAKIIVTGGEVQIADQGSHNGTLVNGERIEGTRSLSSGDAVTVGDAVLVLRCEARAACRAIVDQDRLRQRLAEELERASDYARPLAVVVTSLGNLNPQARAAAEAKAGAALRLMDVLGWSGAAQLVAVLPELGGEA